MKHFSIIALGAVAVMSSCSSRPANQFDLRGSIDGAEGQTIYLRYAIGDSVVFDSTTVVNGAFAFTGNINEPVSSVIYNGSLQMDNKAAKKVYLEPAEMTISGLKAGDYSESKVEGSRAQADVDEYEAVTKPIENRCLEMRQSARQVDLETAKAMQIEMDSLLNAYKVYTYDFIRNHPDSYFAADLLSQQLAQIDFDMLKEMYNGFTPGVQAHIPMVAKEIESIESIQPGKPAPDLVGNNPDGKEIKLSDLKGNVVLIDFWATWCGPCRAALPHIHELYKKYHDKGFEVFCVGDNDSNPDEWVKFINESQDGLTNYHHILRGLKTIYDANGNRVDFDRSNDQSDKYAVHTLPTKYLIAADGTIIGKINTNEELDAKLAEIFGE